MEEKKIVTDLSAVRQDQTDLKDAELEQIAGGKGFEGTSSLNSQPSPDVIAII